MRYSASEKFEIIELVEQSSLSIRRTLAPIGIPRSTFYDWYSRYQEGGIEALVDGKPRPRRIWNKIPDKIETAIVNLALEEPDLSPRELAVNFTDTKGSFVSEATVYRLLKDHGLITSPAFHPDEGGRSLRQSDDRPKPALADRLHLSEGHRLGLVLSVHRAR
jgi:transposase-like protein